jgi:hypothetical protein
MRQDLKKKLKKSHMVFSRELINLFWAFFHIFFLIKKFLKLLNVIFNAIFSYIWKDICSPNLRIPHLR